MQTTQPNFIPYSGCFFRIALAERFTTSVQIGRKASWTISIVITKKWTLFNEWNVCDEQCNRTMFDDCSKFFGWFFATEWWRWWSAVCLADQVATCCYKFSPKRKWSGIGKCFFFRWIEMDHSSYFVFFSHYIFFDGCANTVDITKSHMLQIWWDVEQNVHRSTGKFTKISGRECWIVCLHKQTHGCCKWTENVFILFYLVIVLTQSFLLSSCRVPRH